MPALVPARACTVKELPGKPHSSSSYNLSKILQSWAEACSHLSPPGLSGAWGSVPSSQHWTVPAVHTSYRALGPDPGSGQLSQKG